MQWDVFFVNSTLVFAAQAMLEENHQARLT
jgi:hypothetical protein